MPYGCTYFISNALSRMVLECGNDRLRAEARGVWLGCEVACCQGALRRPSHGITGCEPGIVEDDFRMRWLPAIEEAFEIVSETDLEMRIDAGLTATATTPEPDQAGLMHMHLPIETHIGLAEPVVRPL